MLRSTLLLTAALLGLATPSHASPVRSYPHVVFIVVDTLRADRLSAYGYERATSPRIDTLLASGARFLETRVVEPLTSPSMISLWTGIHPHQHGGTRNGIPLRPDLTSLPKVLSGRGYETVAFVGNWTLRHDLSGLDQHFDTYREVFTCKRWGIFRSEATGEDLTDRSLAWVESHLGEERVRPFLMWIHYVDPHAPYVMHDEFLDRLKIRRDQLSRANRYDTEVAFVDRAIGRLLDGLAKRLPAEDLLIVFVSDHGESLGEHGYWGHGRHLYEPSLRVPLGITWSGRIPAGQVVQGAASSLDVAPTVLGLLGLPVPEVFGGHDWSVRLAAGEGPQGEPPAGRVTRHEAHKGVVIGKVGNARQKGLLEVAVVRDGRKQTWRVKGSQHQVFDLESDPGEIHNLVPPRSLPSVEVDAWLRQVKAGLTTSDALPAPVLDDATLEKLKALGYAD